jgi:hypothetical protein
MATPLTNLRSYTAEGDDFLARIFAGDEMCAPQEYKDIDVIDCMEASHIAPRKKLETAMRAGNVVTVIVEFTLHGTTLNTFACQAT